MSNSFGFQFAFFKTYQKEITKSNCVNRFESKNLCRANCYFVNIQKSEQKKNLPNELFNQWYSFDFLPNKQTIIPSVNSLSIAVISTIDIDFNLLIGHHVFLEKPPCVLV